jgi:hypothetical protein
MMQRERAPKESGRSMSLCLCAPKVAKGKANAAIFGVLALKFVRRQSICLCDSIQLKHRHRTDVGSDTLDELYRKAFVHNMVCKMSVVMV